MKRAPGQLDHIKVSLLPGAHKKLERTIHRPNRRKITDWIETEILPYTLGPVPSRYAFFGALRDVTIEFMKAGDQDGIFTLWRAVDRPEFDANDRVCKQKLLRFRSHLCLAFAESIIGGRNILRQDAPLRMAFVEPLIDLIRRQKFTGDLGWNAWLRQQCTTALQVLGHEPPEDLFRALEVEDYMLYFPDLNQIMDIDAIL